MRPSSPPVMRAVSPTTSQTLSGNKRGYDELQRSLSPVDVHALPPPRSSLKKRYGPIAPPPLRNPYLQGLSTTNLVPEQDKRSRHNRYVLNNQEKFMHKPTDDQPHNKRLTYGDVKTVRIPKKTQRYKLANRFMNQKNKLLRRQMFPNLDNEADDDYTLTNKLETELPSDIEEETEAIVYSPTVEVKPIEPLTEMSTAPVISTAPVSSFYKVRLFVKKKDGSIRRLRFDNDELEIEVKTNETFDKIASLAAYVAVDYPKGFNVLIGQMDEDNHFTEFDLTRYDPVDGKLFLLNDFYNDATIDLLIDLTPTVGGKRSYKRSNKRKHKHIKKTRSKRGQKH